MRGFRCCRTIINDHAHGLDSDAKHTLVRSYTRSIRGDGQYAGGGRFADGSQIWQGKCRLPGKASFTSVSLSIPEMLTSLGCQPESTGNAIAIINGVLDRLSICFDSGFAESYTIAILTVPEGRSLIKSSALSPMEMSCASVAQAGEQVNSNDTKNGKTILL